MVSSLSKAIGFAMRPLLHPSLLNGRKGDPALYIETLFEKHTVLFDLGDLSSLPPRKIHRLEHVFVSHTHIDHFFGFDRLLRVLTGRQKTLNLYGPTDIIEQVHHKLSAYRWNLVDRYFLDLIFVVTEIDPALAVRKARFRLKNAFAFEEMAAQPVSDGVICRERGFRVSTAFLDHGTPCLAFAIEEAAHANIWKNKLLAGLPVGPWLHELKRAVIENKPDDHMIRIAPCGVSSKERQLCTLRNAVTVTPGQKIAYVTDVADSATNRAAIIKLIQGADLLYIEATFAQDDAALAAERKHLTTAAAGSIARMAHVRRVEPFHFSPRYEGDEARMLDEVISAFSDPPSEEAA
jgi:ribonuclease Z